MEIRRYFALIWHWAWLIGLVTIITGSTAYIINRQMEPVYSAETRLLVDLSPGVEYADLLIEERLSQTYIELIRTRPIINETSDRLEEQGYRMGSISVSTIPGTQIIRVSAESTNPEAAAATTNTLSEVFIQDNRERQRQKYADSIATWDQRLVELEAQINEYETRLGELNATENPADVMEVSRLDRQLREAQYSYEDAFEQRSDLIVQEAQTLNNVDVIQDATVPTVPVRPRVTTNTLLATIVGAMVALGIVFLIEYLDDTVKSPEQITDLAGLSTLGAIAYIKGNEPSDRLIAAQMPRAPISEAYRVLRTNLSFSAIDEGLNNLLVTSSSPGEGKSTTVANLAVTIAQTGKRVIIVDADLRRPSQHKIFEVSNNHGLTAALLDAETPVAYHVQNTRVPGLRVLTSGPLPPNPSELLNSQRMSHVIQELQQECDVYLFDTPPALTVADASILAPLVSGCVMVVQIGSTKRDALLTAVDRLRQSGATLYGAVLNQMRPGRSGYYDYYYYYYSNAYPSERPRQQRRFLGWLPRANKS